MKLKIREIKELNLLSVNPLKQKNIDNKIKTKEFLTQNKKNFEILEIIKSIRSITKTWFVYEKLRSEICGWSELNLNWIIEIKKIIKQKEDFLKIDINIFYTFFLKKKEFENHGKKEIICTKINFERNDDYEILF